jgi:hypothetical protein
MWPTLFAQSLGEYGAGSGIAASVASSIQDGAHWLELSLKEDRGMWIAGAICVVLGVWLFRRR